MEGSEVATVVITGVLALFGGAGFWGWWTNRGERPLRKKEVENATLTVVQDTYGDLLKDVNAQLALVQTRLRDQDKAMNAMGDRVTELESIVDDQATTIHKLRRALQHAVDWIEDVHLRWEMYRQRDTPPARPPTNITTEER